MQGRELAERIAVGVVSAWRARVEHIDGHAVSEHDGVVVAWSGLAAPDLSVAIVEREPTDPLAALEAAERDFASHGGTLGLDVERGRHASVDDALRRFGLDVIVTRPAMAVDVARVSPPPPPRGVGFRVAQEPDLAAMARVETDAFDTDPDVARRMIASGLLEHPRSRSYVATQDGDVVGTAYVYEHRGSLGVFGVGVMSSARRRGIGTGITAYAVRDAAEALAGDVAWLQPSEMGRPVYERMGFEVVSTWDVWVRTTPRER
jgi:predicted N-acetyltransferase YhbS